MIRSRADLHLYLQQDKEALSIPACRKRPRLLGDDIWKFERALRYVEYYTNSKTGGVISKLCAYYWKYRYYKLGLKLGFDVPCNVFDYGLRINHFGLLIVNPNCRIGKFCDIHQGVNIGTSFDGGCPTLGDNCWIGPGAKLFGGIVIGNEVAIGAGAIVTKSFAEDNITIVGNPARKIKDTGSIYKRR